MTTAPIENTDAFSFERAHFNMIEQQIRPWRVGDTAVLEVLSQVRRDQFAPEGLRHLAFSDIEIPLKGQAADDLAAGRCMLAPRVEARMLQDLQVRKTDRVLEIGTGSGFMAALLAQQAQEVLSLEIDPALAAMARANLQNAGIRNVQVREADGSQAVAGGPFDVIVLSGSVASVPQHLVELLREGGRLGAVVGQLPVMRATFVVRKGNQFETTTPWDVNLARLQNFPEPSGFRF